MPDRLKDNVDASSQHFNPTMSDKIAKEDKEAKRRKQLKRMTKILSKAWELPNADVFHESQAQSNNENVFDLASLGKNLDDGIYKLGRHGWERFAKDIGGVYNLHVKR